MQVLKNVFVTFLVTFVFVQLPISDSYSVHADELTFVRNGETLTLTGEILAEAEDGGILFQTRSGRLQIVQGDEVTEKIDNDEPFDPLTQKEIGAKLLKELPEDFRIHKTKHFVIAYNTDRGDNRNVGWLMRERDDGWEGFWKTQREDQNTSNLHYPLAALMFKSNAE